MNKALEKLVNASRPEHPRFRDQRLREVIQVLVLLGLKRAGFFEYASFYGGTVLRLLHGLDRFSEDLDFCLHPEELKGAFDLGSHAPVIQETLASFGFRMQMAVEKKCDQRRWSRHWSRAGPKSTICQFGLPLRQNHRFRSPVSKRKPIHA